MKVSKFVGILVKKGTSPEYAKSVLNQLILMPCGFGLKVVNLPADGFKAPAMCPCGDPSHVLVDIYTEESVIR